MKNMIRRLVGCGLALSLLLISGCATRVVTQKESTQDSKTSSVPSSALPSQQKDASLPESERTKNNTSSSDTSTAPQETEELVIPENAVQCELETKLTDIDLKPTGEKIKLSMYIPSTWTADGNTFLEEDSKTAELLAVYPLDDSIQSAIEEKHKDANASSSVSLGALTGQYYIMQHEVSAGGMTALQNELYYYIEWKDYIVSFAFYPKFGMGIGTQRETFETYLSTLRVQ